MSRSEKLKGNKNALKETHKKALTFLNIRCKEKNKSLWKEKAIEQEQSLSGWITRTLNASVKHSSVEFSSDNFDELHEYCSIEGSEYSEYCSNLLTMRIHTTDHGMSKSFNNDLNTELASCLKFFKENSEIIETIEIPTTPIKTTTLKWFNDVY